MNATAKQTKGQPVQEPKVKKDIEMTSDELIKKYGSKSAAIRSLNAQNLTRSQIAKLLNIKYQFVRNVLTQIVSTKAKPATDTKTNGNDTKVTS